MTIFVNCAKIKKETEISDDTLFQKMSEDIGFCEEMFSTILEENIKVVQVVPQNSIKNLQGRSVIVDALCEKQDGTFINVEVQKSDNDNHQKRVRYNASCITANVMDPGTKFEKIPDLIVIYISQFDMFKGNKIIYHVDRTVREMNTRVYNGMEEIYVNTKVEDGSDLAELMRIYTNAEAYNYEQFPNTSIRKAQLKKSREGVEMMCDIVEEYAKEYAEKQSRIAVRQAEEKLSKRLLEEGMPIEKIVSMMEMLSEEDVKRISGEM